MAEPSHPTRLWYQSVNGGVNVGQRAGGRAGRFAAGIEHDAPVRPGGDGRGFAAGAGPGVQEAGVISPVSGSADRASRRRLAFDCLSR